MTALKYASFQNLALYFWPWEESVNDNYLAETFLRQVPRQASIFQPKARLEADCKRKIGFQVSRDKEIAPSQRRAICTSSGLFKVPIPWYTVGKI